MRQLTLCLITMLAANSAYADDPSAIRPTATSELSFLESGRDYIIRFSENSRLFQSTTSGITSTSYTTEDGEKHPGKPATWTMTLAVDIFHVVRFGGGSWVLLEHPSSTEDFAKWNGKRRAMAQLSDPRVAQLEADPKEAARRKKLREAAEVDLPTAKTWINLDHAVAITGVPTEPIEVKFTVKSIDIKNGRP